MSFQEGEPAGALETHTHPRPLAVADMSKLTELEFMSLNGGSPLEDGAYARTSYSNRCGANAAALWERNTRL